MANTPFNFGVQSAPHDAQQCLSPYTPVDVYLLDTKPTTSNLNSTFQFSDYLYYFGNWTLVWTISTLPPYGSPPPSQLTMPDLGASQLRQPVYLAVIEDISECFPGYTDYSIDSRDLVYSGG
ncbi:hypothetical protein PsYK624_142160 [Phanerochaete sordida]|uniref:Uncharacterized protein n=1 Tax=Phanerochaete sordida TaxID=48140 RepID=A0A9P3GPJ7_9APHY|nr:hypothetical protein PsYK624_142160 [Phanerochaete sordida]